MNVEDKNLSIVEQELRFIARHSQMIEGRGGSDFEAVDEIWLAVNSALRALDEHRLNYQQARAQATAAAP
jgi:hypothetical protein